jgi:hypothetical protein
MSTQPGGYSLTDALDGARDDLSELFPDATRITVVMVAEIEQDGQEPHYQIGGAEPTTIEEGERIVRAAGEAVQGTALLRKIQRVTGGGHA